MNTQTKRVFHAAGTLAAICLLFSAPCTAQLPFHPWRKVQATPPASTANSPVTPTPAAAPLNAATPSGLLQPSLDTVQQTLNSLHVERWKRGSVREEAGSDINSILTDMQTNLPPLLKDADSAPGTLSKTLPLSRHVDALYDVLLRVVEAARFSAPDEQANQARLALTSLENARVALDDHIQQAASTQEKQIVDLHAAALKQASFKCPAPPPAPACVAAPTKKAVRKRSAAKKVTPKTSTTAPAANAQKPQTNQTKPQ